jgi:hypothetical protein
MTEEQARLLPHGTVVQAAEDIVGLRGEIIVSAGHIGYVVDAGLQPGVVAVRFDGKDGMVTCAPCEIACT